MMLLVKLPVPVPSLVLLLAVVGFWLVLQQTPRAVTVAPPSEVTFPPLVAVVWVIFEAAVVEITGRVTAVAVIKLTWLP